MSQAFVIRTLWALGCLAVIVTLAGCTVISKAPELRVCQAQRAKLQQEIQVYSKELVDCADDAGKMNAGLRVCTKYLNEDAAEFRRIDAQLGAVQKTLEGKK